MHASFQCGVPLTESMRTLHLQLWDVREKGVVNTFRFENSADDGALQELHSVCVHEQGNKVATGDNCGVLNIWDMRMAATELVEFPESSVQCHTSER